MQQKASTSECGGGDGVTILDAREVDDSEEWEEEECLEGGSDSEEEWLPMVQARAVGGPPRRGKRKR